MDDMISRKDLMKKIAHHTVYDSMRYITFERSTIYEMVKGDMFGLVKDAPAIDAIPHWISVEERTPEDQRAILTANGHGLIRIMALWSKHGDVWMWLDNGHFKHYNDITHWMPLPEPPKKE